MVTIGFGRQSGATVLSALALILVSTIVSLAVAEVALRVAGYEPWRSANWIPARAAGGEVPLMTEEHPERGWANKPGKYVYSGYSAEVETITVSILPDEGRLNTSQSLNFAADQPTLIFIGGSNTFGQAISDHETYPWKIQAMYPESKVHNFAVAGYGTYQSLLTLEEKLPAISGSKIIFYGMIGHHINRTVVDSTWVEMFYAPGKGRLPPYATLASDGSLQRNPVEERLPWPLKDKSALIATAEKAYIRAMTRRREADKVDIMAEVLEELRDFSNRNNAELVVVLLRDNGNWGETRVREYLEQNDYRLADCTPAEYGDEYRVKNEGHPNDKAHTLWAGCINRYLKDHPDIM